MAVEAKRGCGYRKVGGLYMVAGPKGWACDRLPYLLHVCPVCGEGIKHTRGFTWIQPTPLFKGSHPEQGEPCTCPKLCPVCYPLEHFGEEGRASLLWVGEKFYSVEEFMKEAREMGVSRRITAIPRGFELGKTWVFLAHIRAVLVPVMADPNSGKTWDFGYKPGIFMAYRPERLERIVNQSDYDKLNAALCSGLWPKEKVLQKYIKDLDRGVDLIPVPDNDKDHH